MKHDHHVQWLRALSGPLSDDFGTGYSSLSSPCFPLNYLRDGSFVGRMSTADDNSEIVRTITTLARNLGMEVIAEGIETEEQHQQLKSLGCEYGQGYLFSRPVDVEGVLHLLAREVERDSELGVETVNDPDAVFAGAYPM